MSLELRLDGYLGSTTPYAIIRRKSDGYVWSTVASAFAAYLDASVADYDVVLADQGGDLWAADMPSAITAGTYLVQYYDYASGTTPTTSDLQWDDDEFYWDGTTVSDTPAANQYVSLARVKRYLNIDSSVTTYDDRLNDLIPAACRMVDEYCDVISGGFASGSHTEYLSGRGTPYLTTGAFPILTLTRVSILDEVLQITNTDPTTVYARVSTGSAGRTITYERLSTSGGTASSTSTAYTATATFSTIATNIISLGNGWSATAASSYQYRQADDLKTFQGPHQIDVNNSTVSLYAYVYNPGVFGVDEVVGTIRCARCIPAKEKVAKVVYTAGYATIPDDLATAAAALTAALYRRSSRDGSLKSEKIGDYAYTAADMLTGTSVDELSPEAAQLLKRYKRVRCL